MNTLISYTMNEKFIQSKNFDFYLSSLDNLKDCNKFLINLTPSNIDNEKKRYFNGIMHEPCATFFFNFNLLNYLLAMLDDPQIKNSDYVVVNNCEKTLFSNNIFSFLAIFDKFIYFYSKGLLKYQRDETTFKKYQAYLKTNSFNRGNDWEQFYVESNIFAGKPKHLKNILMILLTNLNRNSFNDFAFESILTYISSYYIQDSDYMYCSQISDNFCLDLTNEQNDLNILQQYIEKKTHNVILI